MTARRGRNRICRWLGAIALPLPLVWPAIAAAATLDVVQLKNGEPVPCEILEISDQVLRIKVTIKVGPGEASSVKTISMADVDFIDFAPETGEEYLLENAAAGDRDDLGKLWDAKRANLHRPNSNAGEAGLVYANILLGSGSETDREQAADLFSKIEKEDWNEKRRLRARQGRLRTLIAAGRVEDAVQEALAMAEETEDPEVLIEARYVLATADFDRFRELMRENPKWEEDDLVRPKRNALFNDTVDQFLYPFLFHGSSEAAAARGLWNAIEVFRFAGESDAARARAQDLASLYPENEFAEKARRLLEKASPENAKPTNETIETHGEKNDQKSDR